jgi:hypothetical protein
MTSEDVNDYGDVDFVADPFLYISEEDGYNMFFEIYNDSRTPDAVIGHATSNDGGKSWEYNQVVLNTGYHITFPYVFKWRNNYYMIPEDGREAGDATVGLFKASNFPESWTRIYDICEPSHAIDDSVVFLWDDTWWLLTGDTQNTNGLYIYFSDGLESNNWNPHPNNPVITGRPSGYRPAGRPILTKNAIIAFYQDVEKCPGHKVRAFKITSHSKEEYRDEELSFSPIFEPGNMQ